MVLPLVRPHYNIADVFAEEKASQHGFLRVSAPMVRYSKLEFRKLLRQNGVKLSFTPMIIADSFNRSQKARENEFTTTTDDGPVIAQFAACNAGEFTRAAQLIYPYVDGIDLNVGCPQSWAIKKGYGCGLLRQPEVVMDIMRTVRRTLPADFSVSLKIRLLSGESSLQSTVEFARQLEKCGVNFVTLHGRTMWQKSSDPLNMQAIADVKQSLTSMPLIANGSVRSWSDACELHEATKADGIMAARGLLSNPALFNESYRDCDQTPAECVQQWLDIERRAGDNMQFQCFHHHLTFMWSSHLRRQHRLDFNNFTRKQQVYEFFADEFGLTSTVGVGEINPFEYTKCVYTHVAKAGEKEFNANIEPTTWDSKTNGKFFEEFQTEVKTVDPEEEEGNEIELQGSFFTEMY